MGAEDRKGHWEDEDGGELSKGQRWTTARQVQLEN